MRLASVHGLQACVVGYRRYRRLALASRAMCQRCATLTSSTLIYPPALSSLRILHSLSSLRGLQADRLHDESEASSRAPSCMTRLSAHFFTYILASIRHSATRGTRPPGHYSQTRGPNANRKAASCKVRLWLILRIFMTLEPYSMLYESSNSADSAINSFSKRGFPHRPSFPPLHISASTHCLLEAQFKVADSEGAL